MNKKADIKFEDALNSLEKIVKQLEEGEVSLDNSLKMFEEGIHLSRICAKKLEETEKKIEILVKTKEGDIIKKPFDLEKTNNNLTEEIKTEESSSSDELF